jgi:lipoprotein NlpD
MIIASIHPSRASAPLRSPFDRVSRFAAVTLIALLAVGCATRRPAPVEERAAPARGQSALPAPSANGALAPAMPGAPADAARAEATPPSYTVKPGDTLYKIALDHGLDYRELAAWNNIENVNVIRVGQVLRLSPPGEAPVATAGEGGVTTAPLRSAPLVSGSLAGAPGVTVTPGAPATPGTTPSGATSPPTGVAQGNLKTSPKAIKQPYSDQAVRDITLAATAIPAPPGEAIRPAGPPEARPEPARAPPPDDGDDDRLDWLWPAKGRVVAGFSETANLKGIDIAGKEGDAVVASAPGKVVYAGSGLRGYGKLIIIKHNKTYLSAYAHNKEILVKEGEQVKKGQRIAEMGSSDADQVKLHFEIRRLGKPMDPARYLPPA